MKRVCMKKSVFAIILAGMLAGMNMQPVFATEIEETLESGAEENIGEEDLQKEETEDPAGDNGLGWEMNQDNLVDTDVIDLSLHVETSGEFTAIYSYPNPFLGKDTSKGVVLEFYANPTWEVHELGTIFAFVGTGDYDGRLYFTPGSYLGYNSGNFGGYYDANLYNYSIVTDYIRNGARIRIELLPDGFEVYADDQLCYDQTILDNPEAGAGDFTADSDFSQVLTWLSGADALYFGAGSWWNTVGGNEANIELSEVNFRLSDGTVVMDQLQVDKELVESLGGKVVMADESLDDDSVDTVEINTADVEIFDINSVEYKGVSILPAMAGAVAATLVLAVIIVVAVTKKRTYEDV